MTAAAKQVIREDRCELRASLSVPVTLETSGHVLSARLRNLSEGGAMIEGARNLTVGEPVLISCGSLEARGIVAWEQDNCCGIRFDVPFEESQIARQLLHSSAMAHRNQRLSILPPSKN